MTNSLADIAEAEVIFLTGSNTTETHPVIGTQIRRAVRKGTKLIVADPREIPLKRDACIYLQIKPGTSIALSNAMLHVIIQEGLEDAGYIKDHTEGFEQLKATAVKYPPEKTAAICGVAAEDIRKAARMYAAGRRSAIIYCMGITQHCNGTQNVISLSNLACVTGNIGKPGGGINPLRGQNNVQGACDMGALPNLFTGYQPVTAPETVAKFEQAWGVRLNSSPGLTIPEALHKAHTGEVKLLYIVGENPAVSDPDTSRVEQALRNAFVVVQDLFLTDTARFADVVLPSASFAEKDGTFVNTERRVQRVRKAVAPPGDAKTDWEIIMALMNRMGYPAGYRNTGEIFQEIRKLTPSYSGITYTRIDTQGIQWPCPDETHPGTQILHENGPARGRALLQPVDVDESALLPDKDFPHTMITGRILHQYHTTTMTGRTEGIHRIAGRSYVDISPGLAADLNITPGDRVKVMSRQGTVTAPAKVSGALRDNTVFMPFHWAHGANVLTDGKTVDPVCRIPGLKLTRVKIEKLFD